ncbi:hypothetical protein D9V37_19150 [Nocardioides mangrovicus]|uniref:Uncharacterized protein n=1 Tax=Nocardioides mangrovicus TaxID=2478913 RepID=A0A3L8NZU5_9ACTN|nr:hypothetical protein [Nocardioides mangrovicus]RLV48187.1 hypothetical protein D9V37_19150 [Nocardioides mangrovicus]
MSGGLSVDPAVGLPSGHPVLGSVADGVALPYALTYPSGTSTAHLVLTFDGTTVADVADGAASGTITVAGGTAGLTKNDDVAVVLTALAADGSTIATARTDGTVTDGADLGTLTAYLPAEQDVADGTHLYVSQSATIRFHATAHTRLAHAGVTGYDLTVDGVSILDDPTVTGKPDQWVSGTWTAPATTGDHTLVYWATVEGGTSRTQQSFALSVQPTGSFTIDGVSMDYAVTAEPGSPLPCAGTFKRASDYAPVPNATITVTWQDSTGGDWVPVATTTTDSAGHFSTTLQPTVSGSYQLTTDGVPGVVGGTTSSSVRVDLEAHVRLSVDQRSAGVGSTLTFTIAAPAALAGAHAMLQLWNGMSWTTVDVSPLDATGSASISYVPPISGSYRFGALTGYTEQYAPTASDDLTVSVG